MKSMLYQRQGYKLSIDYEVESRRVLNFYFTSAKSWKKYEYFIEAGNLNQEGKSYKVEPLNEENGLYEGITVMPDSARMMDQLGHWVPQH